jgi:hypothetical protein
MAKMSGEPTEPNRMNRVLPLYSLTIAPLLFRQWKMRR